MQKLLTSHECEEACRSLTWDTHWMVAVQCYLSRNGPTTCPGPLWKMLSALSSHGRVCGIYRGSVHFKHVVLERTRRASAGSYMLFKQTREKKTCGFKTLMMTFQGEDASLGPGSREYGDGGTQENEIQPIKQFISKQWATIVNAYRRRISSSTAAVHLRRDDNG